MANTKCGNERAADQLEAALARFKADRPNGFISVQNMRFNEGVKRIVRHLRTGE
jgi:hypothetical protein